MRAALISVRERIASGDTRLPARLRRPAIISWLLAVAIVLAAFALMLPAYAHLMSTTCVGSVCAPGQPTPQNARALARVGLSVGSYSAALVLMAIAGVLFSLAVSAFVLWRRADDWLALLVTFCFVPLSTATVSYVIQEGRSPWHALGLLDNALTFGLWAYAIMRFPGGRFEPPWSRWIAPLWLGWSAIAFVLYQTHDVPSVHMWHAIVWCGMVISLVVGKVQHFGYITDLGQRQQIKWVIFGGATTASLEVALKLPTIFFPALNRADSLYGVAVTPFHPLADLAFTVAFAIAILRYRLYEVDVIINRALVYTSLTAILGLVFQGSQQILQQVFEQVTGQATLLAGVTSGVLVALLFSPVQRGVRAVVDRRFHPTYVAAMRAHQMRGGTASAAGESPLTAMVTFAVRDLDRAMSFYTGTLGLPGKRDHKGGHINLGATWLRLVVDQAPPDGGSPNPGHAVVMVNNLDEMCGSLEAKGITFAGPAHHDGALRYRALTDPDGNWLYLSS